MFNFSVDVQIGKVVITACNVDVFQPKSRCLFNSSGTNYLCGRFQGPDELWVLYFIHSWTHVMKSLLSSRDCPFELNCCIWFPQTNLEQLGQTLNSHHDCQPLINKVCLVLKWSLQKSNYLKLYFVVTLRQSDACNETQPRVSFQEARLWKFWFYAIHALV